MSTKISSEVNGNNAFGASSTQPIVAPRKPRVYPSRTRLPNKTQWALADMLRHAKDGRGGMKEIAKWIERERLDAKGRFDVARLERLGELSLMVLDVTFNVAELERLAADARLGEYTQTTDGGQPRPEGNRGGPR